jgi:hypothetical protein
MNDWENDKRWSDRFIPEIKRHLGQVLITESPAEEDAKHNTDLIVLTLKPWRVACRVREFAYLGQYGNEFTIRASRPNGTKTELTKIIEGWGDYFFYGFSNLEETALSQWFIGDLNAFRIWHSRELFRLKGEMPGTLHKNRDYSSEFRVYRKSAITEFIVAEQKMIKAA